MSVDLKDLFTYHAPNREQQLRYERLRVAALEFGRNLDLVVPEGADKSAAIRKLRECVMTANAGIALVPDLRKEGSSS